MSAEPNLEVIETGSQASHLSRVGPITSDPPEPRYLLRGLVVVAIVVAIWIGAFFALSAIQPWVGNVGILGDAYGTLNALFSGLAFAAVACALFLQRKDLKFTQEELRRSTAAQEMQQRMQAIAAEIHGRSTLAENLLAQMNMIDANLRATSADRELRAAAQSQRRDHLLRTEELVKKLKALQE